ncbi:MAG: hypothetical protein QF773_02585 [Lentisphaeria bacterium]|nr:hypothetical protein [Lentisphaeria bacterium]
MKKSNLLAAMAGLAALVVVFSVAGPVAAAAEADNEAQEVTDEAAGAERAEGLESRTGAGPYGRAAALIDQLRRIPLAVSPKA